MRRARCPACYPGLIRIVPVARLPMRLNPSGTCVASLALACSSSALSRWASGISLAVLLSAAPALSLGSLLSHALSALLPFWPRALYRVATRLYSLICTPSIYSLLIILPCDRCATGKYSECPDTARYWGRVPTQASPRKRPLARAHSKTSEAIAHESSARTQRLQSARGPIARLYSSGKR